jgi:signal transduction histidine kinase
LVIEFNPLITSLLVTLVIALSFPVLDTKLRAYTDRWLYQGSYHYSQELLSLSKSLAEHTQRHRLVEHLVAELNRVLRTKGAKVVIAHPRQTALVPEALFGLGNSSLYVPVLAQDRFVGTLYCSPKKSGEAYTQQDLEFVETISLYIAQRLLQSQEISELQLDVHDSQQYVREEQKKQNTMIVDLAHNLQTPLTILKGEVHALKERQKDLSYQDLERLDSSIDSFSQFVTRLLQAGQQSQQAYTMTDTNISSLVDELCEYSQTVAAADAVELRYDVEPDLYMYADRDAIKDLLLNLLSNAIKYRREGTESYITVTLRSEDKRVILEVSDNGQGIDPQYLPRLFEPWTQGESGHKGSGLGMTIVKRIVDAHKGTIHVKSEADRGTTVSMSFMKS